MHDHRFNKGAVALFIILSIAAIGSSCAFKSGSKTSNTAQAGAIPPDQSKHEPAQNLLPPPTGLINDYQNVFTPDSKEKLESVLKQLRDKSDIEFAVVTIETTGEKTIFDYSLALAREWGIGSAGASKGGLLLLLAIKDRKWRIQVSDSLLKDLPNEVSKQLGDESEPLYRQGNYAAGITKYVQAIIARLEKRRGFKLGA